MGGEEEGRRSVREGWKERELVLGREKMRVQYSIQICACGGESLIRVGGSSLVMCVCIEMMHTCVQPLCGER